MTGMGALMHEHPLAHLIHAPTLLVAVDFDGTIAPLVDDPADAQALPEAAKALDELSTLKDTRVALISGRALDDLLSVVPPLRQAILVGSHGAEFMNMHSTGSMGYTPEMSRTDHNIIALLASAAQPLVDAVDGAWIEHKATGIAVHTRLAQSDRSKTLYREIEREFERLELKPHRRRGHDVSEYSISTLTKGDAINRLRDLTGASTTAYFGDDVTDEDAFAELKAADVGVKCGAGETHASFRVPTPKVVSRVLSNLAQQRACVQRLPNLHSHEQT